MSFITNEPDRIIFHNEELAEEVIHDIAWEQTPGIDDFNELFEPFGGRDLLCSEDYYQGLNKVCVIRRKSDGRLFGFEYFDDISKHGETWIEANGHDVLGDPDDPEWYNDDNYEEPYVFLPVEPFEIQAYRVIKEK